MLRRSPRWPSWRTWRSCRSIATHQNPCSRPRLQPLILEHEAVSSKPRRTSRCFATSNIDPSQPELVRVRYPSTGHLTLRIHRPAISNATPAPVIIYLPTGPIVDHVPGYASKHYEAVESSISAVLSAAANAVVVQVDYSLGDGHMYPSPVHQVVFAFDWARDNLVSSPTFISRPGSPGRAVKTTQLGVCGQLIGGSLATALAVTEGRAGQTRIGALAAHNPIVDWIFPEHADADGDSEPNDDALVNELNQPSLRTKSRRKHPLSSWTAHRTSPVLPAQSLLATRAAIFRRPSSYFDPFASPVLFFRSPGADVPLPSPPTPDLTSSTDTDNPAVAESEQNPPTRRRKVPRVFPPSGSGLLTPHARFSVGGECVLRDQVMEIGRLMGRGVEREYASEGEGEGRVAVEIQEGPGCVWGSGRVEEWRAVWKLMESGWGRY